MDEELDLYAVLLLESGGAHVPQVAIRKAYRARAQLQSSRSCKRHMMYDNAKVTTSAPFTLGSSLIGAGYSSYQDVTFQKMRQAAERAMLEKEIREADSRAS